MAEVSRGRRMLGTRAAAAVAIALCGLAAVLTLFAVLLDDEAVTRRVVEGLLPRASEQLGREISLESARAKLLPRPRVTLGGLRVAGRPGEPPLLEAPEVSVELSLWTLLRSFGQEVEVRAVRVVRPELNLLRDRDGTWNFEGLGTGESSDRAFSLARATVQDATVRIIDRASAHGEAAVALTRLDLTLRDLAAGVPVQVRLNAAVASEAQNLSMDVRVDHEGPHPAVDGHLALTRAQLTRLEGLLPARLGTVVMGGVVDLDGRIETGADGAWALDATARLDGVRLRGEPASGGLHLRARVNPADSATARVEVDDLSLQGPGVELGGQATLTVSPVALDFAVQGPLLDLDALLAVLPEEQVTQPPPRTSMLPANTRRALDEVTARGTLRVDRVVRGGLELHDLDAQAELRRGKLTLTRARAQLYEGELDASGSDVNLLLAEPAWNLRARLSGVDAGKLAAAVESEVPLEGRLDAALFVRGAGAQWSQVRQGVTGEGVLSLREGKLRGTDLGAQLGAAIPKGPVGGTPLRDLTLSFRVADGQMTLREPLVFASGFGGVRLDGRIGLDTSLALQGEAQVSPEFLARHTGVRPRSSLKVPLEVGGTLAQPRIEPSPAAEAVRPQLEDEVKRQARRRAGELLRRLGRED
jgi:AsmA protein